MMQDEVIGILDLSRKRNQLPFLKLPQAVYELTHLEELILRGHRLGEDFSFEGNAARIFPKLKKLDLSGNPLPFLPRFFQDHPTLEELVLCQCQLGSSRRFFSPESIGLTSNLKRLDLRFNPQLYVECNTNFDQLEELRLAKLDDYQGHGLFDSCKKLKRLEITQTYWSSVTFQQFLYPLEELEEIRLSFSLVDRLFLKFFDFKDNLKRLRIENSMLKEIPRDIANHGSLEELHLPQNKLKCLPSGLIQNRQLQILDLSGNLLTQVPSKWSQLRKLEELNLSGNQITHIPESFKNFKRLKKLYLSHNQLKQFPEHLLKIASLERLEVMFNHIKQFPKNLNQYSSSIFSEMGNISSDTLELQECPFCHKTSHRIMGGCLACGKTDLI